MKEEILKEYKYKTELHAHTLPVSLCSGVYAEELVKIYKELGADSIALTNHFTPDHISGCSKDETVTKYIACFNDLKECAEKNGITAIFGMELRFTENINDYLLYGVREEDVARIYEFVDKGIDYFYRNYKNDRFLIFQAHPFRDKMVRANPESLDGIETFNLHPGHNSRIAFATSYAKEHNMLVCGGTDFHKLGQQGGCFIRTKTKLQDSHDVAQVLKNKEFVFDIFENIVLP